VVLADPNGSTMISLDYETIKTGANKVKYSLGSYKDLFMTTDKDCPIETFELVKYESDAVGYSDYNNLNEVSMSTTKDIVTELMRGAFNANLTIKVST